MALAIWTVYDSPTDYPGKFVARKWLANTCPTATDEIVEGETLAEVRGKLPPNLFRMDRAPGDDSKIVETWM